MKFRKSYKKNYTTIDNMFINDMQLSLKAKGLFLYLWSKPDDWVVKAAQMAHIFQEGRAAIYSALKELEENGYLMRKFYSINGRIAGIHYTIDDTKDFNFDNNSQEIQDAKITYAENQYTENQYAENRDDYIVNKDNTKIKTIPNKESTKDGILSTQEIKDMISLNGSNSQQEGLQVIDNTFTREESQLIFDFIIKRKIDNKKTKHTKQTISIALTAIREIKKCGYSLQEVFSLHESGCYRFLSDENGKTYRGISLKLISDKIKKNSSLNKLSSDDKFNGFFRNLK